MVLVKYRIGIFFTFKRVFIVKILFSVVSYATPINAKNLKKQHYTYHFQYQRFIKSVTQKVITFLSPREQREREILDGFTG